MKTLSLALRNLLRNRRRSLTTMLAMIVGAVSILLFGGYSHNINYGLQTGYVRSGGHLQIQHKDYFLYGSGNPAAYGIAEYEHVIDIVKHDPVLATMVTVATPTLQLGGIAGNFSAGASRTVIANGVVVDDQNHLREWNDYGFQGKPKTLSLTGTSPDSVIVGNGVARVLQLCSALHVHSCTAPIESVTHDSAPLPADVAALAVESTAARSHNNEPHIEMLAATTRGAPNVAELRVVKAEDQGVKELDDIYVGMHLSQAQHLVYGNDAPQATAVVVQLKHTAQIPIAKARLEYLLATALKSQSLEIQVFTMLNPYYGQAMALFGTIFSFISILIGSIVLFTVGNTMSMAVVERTVEIGTLRAMGLRRTGIRRLFITEGVLLGLIGALLGVLMALLLAALINHSGFTWTPPGRVEPVTLNVRVWGEATLIVATAIGLVTVAVLSAWWPARRAAQLNIVEALRHV